MFWGCEQNIFYLQKHFLMSTQERLFCFQKGESVLGGKPNGLKPEVLNSLFFRYVCHPQTTHSGPPSPFKVGGLLGGILGSLTFRGCSFLLPLLCATCGAASTLPGSQVTGRPWGPGRTHWYAKAQVHVRAHQGPSTAPALGIQVSKPGRSPPVTVQRARQTIASVVSGQRSGLREMEEVLILP